jgi:hypothetical protein
MTFIQEPIAWSWNDPEQLWKLAHKLEETQLWAGYLSENEHSIWRKALRARDTWSEFLGGCGEGIDVSASQDSSESTTKDGDNGEKSVDPVTTAFRARMMLFEPSVRKLFPPQTGEDLMDFDIEAISGGVQVDLPEERPKARDIEEDDYDDNDDNEDHIAVVPTVLEHSSHDGSSSLGYIGMPELFTFMTR